MRFIEPLRSVDPERIGPYRLTGRLGEGGQGVVYRAEAADGAPVALKVLHPRRLRGARTYDRLSDEIAVVRRVADFCTARIIELGSDGDRSYLVSEYVDGPSLQEFTETEGPLTGGALARLMVGTVSALAAIHRAGVLHRVHAVQRPDGPGRATGDRLRHRAGPRRRRDRHERAGRDSRVHRAGAAAR